jgi:hypothetical protein
MRAPCLLALVAAAGAPAATAFVPSSSFVSKAAVQTVAKSAATCKMAALDATGAPVNSVESFTKTHKLALEGQNGFKKKLSLLGQCGTR